MISKIKALSIFVLSVVIIAFSCFTCFAEDETSVRDRLLVSDNGIMSIAHRGNTALYPKNSLEGIKSAAEIGADMISVNVRKTSDGVLMLCEEGSLANICESDKDDLSEMTAAEAQNAELYSQPTVLSGYRMASLESALSVCDGGVMLICDFDWAIADDIYDFLLSQDALSKVILRTDTSAGKIEKWFADKKEKPMVIGIYDDNIVFTAISHIEKLSALGMPAVQYESKNYFNVIFGEFTAKRYSEEGNCRAIAAFYERDRSGQRGDGEDGWNELIKKGFSVIETNNIAALVAYINSGEELTDSLAEVHKKATELDLSIYSEAGREKLTKAMKVSQEILERGYGANDELQSAQSDLIYALDCLALKTGDDTQKGALNITVGKVVAVVLVGAALFAAQIFVHKMQKGKQK